MKRLLLLFIFLLPILAFGQTFITQQNPISSNPSDPNYNSQAFKYAFIYSPLVLSAPIGVNAVTNTAHPVEGQFTFRLSDTTIQVYHNGHFMTFGGGGSSSAIYFSLKYFGGAGTFASPIIIKTDSIYPSMMGQSGKFLTNNGSTVSWATITGGLTNASNGLHTSGDTVQFGGTLGKNTNIDITHGYIFQLGDITNQQANLYLNPIAGQAQIFASDSLGTTGSTALAGSAADGMLLNFYNPSGSQTIQMKGVGGIPLTDQINLLGLVNAADYSTNIKLHPFALVQTNMLNSRADSIVNNAHNIYNVSDSLKENRTVFFSTHQLTFGDTVNSKALFNINPITNTVFQYVQTPAFNSIIQIFPQSAIMSSTDTLNNFGQVETTINAFDAQVENHGIADYSYDLHFSGANEHREAVFTDNLNHKGLTYRHIQMANFTDSTLVMKRYVDSVTSAITGFVPTSRTLTINGTTQDLSANRTWSVGTVTSVATGRGLIGGTITSTGTLGLDTTQNYTWGKIQTFLKGAIINLNSGSQTPQFTDWQTVVGADASNVISERYTYNGHDIDMSYINGGNRGTNTAVGANTELKAIGAKANDGTGYPADGTVGWQYFTYNAQTSGDHSSYILGLTVPSGSTTLTPQFEIANNGLVYSSNNLTIGDPSLSHNNLFGYTNSTVHTLYNSSSNAAAASRIEIGAGSSNTGNVIGSIDFDLTSNSSSTNYRAAEINAIPSGSTSGNLGGTLRLASKKDNGALTLGLLIDQNQNLTFSNYTTNNGLLYTNGSGVVSQSTALPNGTTGTTQSAGDNSTKVATTAYVNSAVGLTFRGIGQTTLVSGTKAISISGVTTSSIAFVQAVSQGGTVSTTFEYSAVCTSGTLTITALTTGNVTNTLDQSTLNYYVVN